MDLDCFLFNYCSRVVPHSSPVEWVAFGYPVVITDGCCLCGIHWAMRQMLECFIVFDCEEATAASSRYPWGPENFLLFV